MKKHIDRHVEPKRVTFAFPIEEEILEAIHDFAKKNDRTRASILREAAREWLEKRSA
jgi:predicted DNA-binding protein